MNGRVCMITGATSGIGKATALGLARMGATVVIVGREGSLGEKTAEEIRASTGNPAVRSLTADLSSRMAVRGLAEAFHSQRLPLHVLINNAGIALSRRSTTADGVETTIAVNYLAPFLLTSLLLGDLVASAPARVVNVAGDFHREATLDFDDLMSERGYSGLRANNQAKLALILFTYELARRLRGTGVTANCLHPCAVATDAPLKDPHLSGVSRLMVRLFRPFFLSPERGAETSIYLASAPEVAEVSGKYFIKKKPVASSPESYDAAKARRLWDVSLSLAGLTQVDLHASVRAEAEMPPGG